MLFGRIKRTLHRVLIVEDEPLIAFETEYFLADEGFQVVATVDKVADAASHIDTGDVHLVLVDMTLADGSGVDVARAAAAKGVAVLFVTGDAPVGAEGLAHGCLMKPYTQRNLLKAIATVDQVVQGDRPKKLPTGMTLFERSETSAA